MTPQPKSSDRLPPYDADAERGILGCIFQDPQVSIGRCVEALSAGGQAFYDLRHRTIYEACVGMYEAGIPADVVSLADRLRALGMLDQVGGMIFLSGLPDAAPSAANLPTYIDIVLEKYTLRGIIRTCTEAVQSAYEIGCESVSGLLDRVESDILKIRAANDTKGDAPIKAIVAKALDDIEAEFIRQGALGGIATGFHDFDRLTGGLQNSDMIVIGARPSVGKTTWAANVVDHAAVDLGLPVGVFSLEMSDRSIVKRLLCSRAQVNMRTLGQMAERDFSKLSGAAGKISNAPIYINDTGGLSIMQLRAKARRWHREHSIKLIVIDYLQLLNATGSGRRYESRQQEVTEISAGIKNLAKELDIPVIVLCQLNRDVEKRARSKPLMSDLRESGAIEQDADIVSFLYRPPDDGEEQGDQDTLPVNLFIAKQRNGPSGDDVHLLLLKSITRFESASRLAPDDQ